MKLFFVSSIQFIITIDDINQFIILILKFFIILIICDYTENKFENSSKGI